MNQWSGLKLKAPYILLDQEQYEFLLEEQKPTIFLPKSW